MDAKKLLVATAATLLGLVLIVVVILAPASTTIACAPPSGAAAGAISPAGTLVKPTASDTTTDSSGFGPRWGTVHQGIDRAGPVGTPIYAFTDGRVAEAGEAAGFGHWIILDHEIDGRTYSTVYGHMFADGVLVSAGQHVSAGQEIGKIGNDGESTGAHLHFEVWEGARLPDGAGTAVDPAPWVAKAAEPGTAAQPQTSSSPGAGTGGLNAAQLALAKQTVAIGEAMGVPEQGIVVALATEGQESTYRMLASSNVPDSTNYPHDGIGSDHLSVNQFQQQVTIWGTTEELMNPVTANIKFYTALLKIPGWQSMAVTDAAQAVQGSGHPGAYADDEPLARQLYAQFKGARADLTADDLAAIANNGTGAVATAVVDGGTAPGACTPPAGGTSGGPTFVPGGPFGANVIAAASRWIGTPYAWGGGDSSGPTRGISDGGGAADANGDTSKTGFDCSGLTLYAVFQASGGKITLPHYTGDTSNPGQLGDPRGQQIPFEDKQPGDLIYFGSGGNTHHVGIYTGTEGGQDMLLNAPQSGQTVSIMPLSGWAGEDMYVRRFG